MSEELNTQAATDTTNTEAKPSAEAAGAPDKTNDLDALLEQYRKETGSPGTPQAAPAASPPPAADMVPRSEFDAFRAEVARERMGKELDEFAKSVRAAGDLPDFLTDNNLIGILDREAALDPALTRAWVESRGNPKARAALARALGDKLGKQFAKARGVDEQATADREAVAASVRGASTKAPEGKAPDYGKLSDNEFRKQVEKDYGFTPF